MVFFVLIPCLLVAAFMDYTKERIPNRLCVIVLILGIVQSLFPLTLFQNGISFAAFFRIVELFWKESGLFLELCLCLLPFYVIRCFGAGDIKLFIALIPWFHEKIWVVVWGTFALCAFHGAILLACRRKLWKRIRSALSYVFLLLRTRRLVPYVYGIGQREAFTLPVGSIIFEMVLFYSVFEKWGVCV